MRYIIALKYILPDAQTCSDCEFCPMFINCVAQIQFFMDYFLHSTNSSNIRMAIYVITFPLTCTCNVNKCFESRSYEILNRQLVKQIIF